ncbi:hypothetical protein U27_00901 [Candidatus Vecturithrix granuli]|uniref:Uncharacterized protein n=1 Tax=Vecturithrix granuli TaxID=1499967 RepID=A0A081C8U8_VECG1|nr:hypothetical protein U27_00901 [Candidatus Vecturithrix granuli]
MVRGLEIFRSFFKEYTGNYVLIGGAACDEHISEAGLTFRATKDLDIMLIIETLHAEFIARFWEFIKAGGYGEKQKSQRERKYYRFMKPLNAAYPEQVELFARQPDLLDLPDDAHLTPIPVVEDISSLSAILMYADYYHFAIANSEVAGNLHRVTIKGLICLKAKAFLNLTAAKEQGEKIDERDIKKHKNDVIRLAVLLTDEDSLILPDSIGADIHQFMLALEQDPPDFRTIAHNMGLPDLDPETVMNQIHLTFHI